MTQGWQQVKQFYFGSDDRRLFGVLHMPGEGAPRPAIVICNPFGVEAVRAHRFLRLLADMLSRQGHPVLRFDYFGTGDSAGACTQFTLSGATGDILSAHQELMDVTGAQRVFWLGLRLGAGLALSAATARPRGLGGLILWSPVVDGRTYIEGLQAAHLSDLGHIFDLSADGVRRMTAGDRLEAELQGTEISPAALAEFRAFQADAIDQRLARTVIVIGEDTDKATEGLADRLTDTGSRVQRLSDPAGDDWNSDAALNAFQTPIETLKLIADAAGEMR